MKHSCFFTFFISCQFWAFAQNYKVEKEPSWVKLLKIPENSEVKKYDVSSGYYLSLADYQINLEENAFYSHEVSNVVSYSGITKASQISATYDSSYQKLKIHHLFIWRTGIKMDRTSELNFKILNNEYELDQGIYMGLITVYCNLNDIRKDDQIDFSYTLIGKNPIFKEHKYLFLPIETSNPIDLYSIRVLYSRFKEYNYKCVGENSLSCVTNSILGNYRELELVQTNTKPILVENNIPSWLIPYRFFTLTSFKSWKEVNIWAQDVFALKKPPVINQVFKEIFNGNETRDEKINKLINYVQDDIRYMGMESGIGSIKPFPPEQVIKQRFGDCKDKSLLLVSLLKQIGIEQAYPALVNTYLRNETNKQFPSGEIFNHCIVNFIVDSVNYWVDPTITQQGGNYKNISIAEYGKALIIGLTSDSLSTMKPASNISSCEILDEYFITSFNAPAQLRMTSKRYGFEADMRRFMFEQYSADTYANYVTEDLKKYYPEVTQQENMKLDDDINTNVFTSSYKYEIDKFWIDGDKMSDKSMAGYWIFKYEPSTILYELNNSPCSKRKYDFAQHFPYEVKYEVLFHFPKELMLYDSYKKIDTEAFYFDERFDQLSPNSIKLSMSYKNKTSSISADMYDEVCDTKTKIAKNLTMYIYLKK